MKRKILLLNIMCISICINAQNMETIPSDTTLTAENNVSELLVKTEEMENLQNNMQILQKKILTIENELKDISNLKQDIQNLSDDISQLISEFKFFETEINSKINVLESNLGESTVIIQKDIKDINSSLDDNQNQLDSVNHKLINQRDEIEDTKSKTDETSMLSLISLFLGLLLIVSLIVIYKLTSKNISNNKNEIKDILKLDNQLKNILEKHTKILESDSGQDSQEETLKSLKIVADEIMTMENNIFQMTDAEKNSRGLKRIKRAIKNLRNNYKTMGYDIPELLGSEWKEGDIIEIISEIPDENIEKGKRIITRVVSPRIDFNGEMIQRAKVELKSNI